MTNSRLRRACLVPTDHVTDTHRWAGRTDAAWRGCCSWLRDGWPGRSASPTSLYADHTHAHYFQPSR